MSGVFPPRSASITSAPCAVASAGCSPRPCSFTAPVVSPMAASQTSTSVFNANTVLCCSHLPPVFGASAFSDTRVGWTAGAGLEWMFMPNWSAKVEYLYYDLGTVNSAFFIPAVDNVTGFQAFFAGQSRARFNGNIVRAGVNYHFNWGAAPIVAKY